MKLYYCLKKTLPSIEKKKVVYAYFLILNPLLFGWGWPLFWLLHVVSSRLHFSFTKSVHQISEHDFRSLCSSLVSPNWPNLQQCISYCRNFFYLVMNYTWESQPTFSWLWVLSWGNGRFGDLVFLLCFKRKICMSIISLPILL